ncbi:MAG TPA: hypothetical protein VGJ30_09825 [Candidatus Angelobacter sp.]|jgi:hypothetical protein
MKTRVLIAAGFGFLVPIILGCMMMLEFNAADSGWVHFVCYQLPYIVCPPWVLGDGSGFWFVAMPLLNSATYAALAFLIVKVRSQQVIPSGHGK